jgi:hypothetical protein
MGFLWNANTASDQKVSMGWQQFSAGASTTLGATSPKFSHLAATGDAYGVSDITAP